MAARLARIADYWADLIPGNERLARHVIREQADDEGLLFTQKQINATIRRAWSRLPEDKRSSSPSSSPSQAQAESTSSHHGSYNQDQDEDQAQDQDQNQGTAPPRRKSEQGGLVAPAPPPQLFYCYGDHVFLDLLERYRRGQLHPAPVELGPMPPGATESMRKVAEDIALLVGVRLAVDDDRPLIYSTSFCAWRMGWSTWAGAPDKPRATRVLRKLIDAGVIDCVGTMPRSDSRLFAAPSSVSGRRRPGPQVPTVSVQPRVQPVGEVEQQCVVHQAQPVRGEHLGVVAPSHPARPWDNGSDSDPARELHPDKSSTAARSAQLTGAAVRVACPRGRRGLSAEAATCELRNEGEVGSDDEHRAETELQKNGKRATL